MLAVPLGLLLGAWTMRYGIAGWATALATAFFAPLALAIGLAYQLLDPTAAAIGTMLVLTLSVVILAGVMWAATRLICPQALLDELP